MRSSFWLISLLTISSVLNVLTFPSVGGQLSGRIRELKTQAKHGMGILADPDPDDLMAVQQIFRKEEFSTQGERIDAVQHWVHENSVHLPDLADYSWNQKKVLAMMLASDRGEGERAIMNCGPRATAMMTILDGLGIPNRMVMIFSDLMPRLRTHTFLDVYNEDLDQWVLHDPDFDIVYLDQRTGRRVSTVEMLWADLNSVIPVRRNVAGWDELHIDFLKDFFGAVMISLRPYRSKSIIIINSDRFDGRTVFPQTEGISFYELAQRHYDEPTVLLTREMESCSSPQFSVDVNAYH